MISQKKKFLFIHIPKTGGTSIQSVMGKYSEDTLKWDMFDGRQYNRVTLTSNIPEISRHSPLRYYGDYYDLSKFYKITCVRNPWDRVMSWYFRRQGFMVYDDFDKDDFFELIRRIRDDAGTTPTSFSPQVDFIKDSSGKLNMDFIMRYESLQKDFNRVCDILEIPRETLPVLNRSKNSIVNYQDFYTNRTRRMVANAFKEDIRYFKYTF